jgi:flagellar biosynthesis/type III secretory pathway ATPase
MEEPIADEVRGIPGPIGERNQWPPTDPLPPLSRVKSHSATKEHERPL